MGNSKEYEKFLNRCAVCGAKIDAFKGLNPTVVRIEAGAEFIIATSKGEKIHMHSECLGDLIAFLIELKKKAEAENP